jgi:octaprenyl-diphosphate synthase
MTLPLIYLLNRSSRSEKRLIINLVKNHSNEPDKVQEVISKVRASGGLEYSTHIMNELTSQAMTLLENYAESEARASLKSLVEYSIKRKN